MGFQMISPPRTELEADVATMPMMAVTPMVRGVPISCDKVGECFPLAYRVQSDWPRVPPPQAPSTDVSPYMKAQPMSGASFFWWKRGPAPWAVVTLLRHVLSAQILDITEEGMYMYMYMYTESGAGPGAGFSQSCCSPDEYTETRSAKEEKAYDKGNLQLFRPDEHGGDESTHPDDESDEVVCREVRVLAEGVAHVGKAFGSSQFQGGFLYNTNYLYYNCRVYL
jgi:hypothetical protein